MVQFLSGPRTIFLAVRFYRADTAPLMLGKLSKKWYCFIVVAFSGKFTLFCCMMLTSCIRVADPNFGSEWFLWGNVSYATYHGVLLLYNKLKTFLEKYPGDNPSVSSLKTAAMFWCQFNRAQIDCLLCSRLKFLNFLNVTGRQETCKQARSLIGQLDYDSCFASCSSCFSFDVEHIYSKSKNLTTKRKLASNFYEFRIHKKLLRLSRGTQILANHSF